MFKTTSLEVVGEKSADQSNFGNEWNIKLKAKEVVDKHRILVDKFISHKNIS